MRTKTLDLESNYTPERLRGRRKLGGHFDPYNTTRAERKYPQGYSRYKPVQMKTQTRDWLENNRERSNGTTLDMRVGEVLGAESLRAFKVIGFFGQGTFGQVAKCKNLRTGEIVAVKIVKNQPACYNQSLLEIKILQKLNFQWPAKDGAKMIQLKDQFVHKQHLCLVFEALSISLYDLIKLNGFRGLPLETIRDFSRQLVVALASLNASNIIHCDLKPENILLEDEKTTALRIIDFGSACEEHKTIFSYVQSRFYRSPEVLLGLPYSSMIDMWSLGCILIELYVGVPLFPGSSEYNQLTRIIDLLGLPPIWMLELGCQTPNFFKIFRDFEGFKRYILKDIETYRLDTGKDEKPSTQYIKSRSLKEIITSYSRSVSHKYLKQRGLESIFDWSNNDMDELQHNFLDFLSRIIRIDPTERMNPQEALYHPFIFGANLKHSTMMDQTDSLDLQSPLTPFQTMDLSQFDSSQAFGMPPNLPVGVNMAPQFAPEPSFIRYPEVPGFGEKIPLSVSPYSSLDPFRLQFGFDSRYPANYRLQKDSNEIDERADRALRNTATAQDIFAQDLERCAVPAGNNIHRREMYMPVGSGYSGYY